MSEALHLGSYIQYPTRKLTSSKNRVASQYIIPWPQVYNYVIWKQDWPYFDDFELSNPTIQKKKSRKCATSIVERVTRMFPTGPQYMPGT